MRSLIGASIVILVIILVRKIFSGKISHKVQYALWLAVPVYLICSFFFTIPVTVSWMHNQGVSDSLIEELFSEVGVSTMSEQTGSSEASNIEKGETSETSVHSEQVREAADQSAFAVSQADTSGIQKTFQKQNGSIASENEDSAKEIQNQKTDSISMAHLLSRVERICHFISLAIMAFLFIWNLAFWISVRGRRKYFRTIRENGIHVYTLSGIDSPFLFGRSIYINPDIRDDKQVLGYSVLHEYCHYKQGDSVWPVVRFFILAVYWYNPLVWAAFIMSGRDSELSCDERVIERIGVRNRIIYGDILIRMIRRERFGRSGLVMTTGMAGKKSEIKERITFIAKPSEKKAAAAIAAVLVTILAGGCALVSPSNNTSNSAISAENGSSGIGMTEENGASMSTGTGLAESIDETDIEDEKNSGSTGTDVTEADHDSQDAEVTFQKDAIHYHGENYFWLTGGIYRDAGDGDPELLAASPDARGVVIQDRMYWGITDPDDFRKVSIATIDGDQVSILKTVEANGVGWMDYYDGVLYLKDAFGDNVQGWILNEDWSIGEEASAEQPGIYEEENTIAAELANTADDNTYHPEDAWISALPSHIIPPGYSLSHYGNEYLQTYPDYHEGWVEFGQPGFTRKKDGDEELLFRYDDDSAYNGKAVLTNGKYAWFNYEKTEGSTGPDQNSALLQYDLETGETKTVYEYDELVSTHKIDLLNEEDGILYGTLQKDDENGLAAETSFVGVKTDGSGEITEYFSISKSQSEVRVVELNYTAYYMDESGVRKVALD